MTGFVTMQRGALEHPLFDGDVGRLGAWMWLVGKACWKPTPFNISGKMVTLERGQLCVSVRQLAENWGWSKSTVDRFLTRLETETMIAREAGHGRLILTITNYSKYQDVGDPTRDSSGTVSGTAAGQQRDIKEQGNKGTILEEPDGSSLGERDECEQVVGAFNAVAAPLKLSTCQKLSPKRLQACKARIRDHGLEAILTAIQRIPDSSFLCGRSGNWGGANIDFLLRPDSVTKILEGRYDDRTANRTGQSADDHRDGFTRALHRDLYAHHAAGVADEPFG